MMTLKQRLCELATIAYPNGDFDSSTLSEYDDLGSGSTRKVVAIEHDGKVYAVKFAYWQKANRYNRREARTWRTFREVTRRLLAEVHAISTCGRVLAMELIPQTLNDTNRRHETCDWNRNLRSQLENGEAMTYDEAANMISDNASFNIGVRANGEIVWIDYASGSCPQVRS